MWYHERETLGKVSVTTCVLHELSADFVTTTHLLLETYKSPLSNQASPLAAAVSLVSSVNLLCIAFVAAIFVSALKGESEWEGLPFHSVPQTNCCGDTAEEIREALPRESYSPLQTHTGPIMAGVWCEHSHQCSHSTALGEAS